MHEPQVAGDPRAVRSRERILSALHRAGIEGGLTNITALSVAAGITRATIYNHFGSLEEAAWFAVLDGFELLLDDDAAHRRQGVAPDLVGADSLRRVIEMLRAEESLVRLADTYRSNALLPGVAGIVLRTVQTFRGEFSPPTGRESEAEDIYVAAGLYAVLSTGAWSKRDPGEVAGVAYALLPNWMRRPTRA